MPSGLRERKVGFEYSLLKVKKSPSSPMSDELPAIGTLVYPPVIEERMDSGDLVQIHFGLAVVAAFDPPE